MPSAKRPLAVPRFGGTAVLEAATVPMPGAVLAVDLSRGLVWQPPPPPPPPLSRGSACPKFAEIGQPIKVLRVVHMGSGAGQARIQNLRKQHLLLL